MVYIYRIGPVYCKKNGINKLHNAYYRTVYYKTKSGKSNTREMRCRMTGKLYAKSKIWDISNFVSKDVENNDERVIKENKDKAEAKRQNDISEKRHTKRVNNAIKKMNEKKDERRRMDDIVKGMVQRTLDLTNERPEEQRELTDKEIDDMFADIGEDEPAPKKHNIKKKVKHIKDKTDYKRPELDWQKVYGSKDDPNNRYLQKIFKNFAKAGFTKDDIAYCMGFARSKDQTYDKQLKPKAINKQTLLEFSKYPWKYEFAKKHFPAFYKLWKEKLRNGEVKKSQIDPTDEQYNKWEKEDVERHNKKLEEDNAQIVNEYGHTVTQRKELGRMVTEMNKKKELKQMSIEEALEKTNKGDEEPYVKDIKKYPKFYNYQYWRKKDIDSLNKDTPVEEICIEFFTKMMNTLKNGWRFYVAPPHWMYDVATENYDSVLQKINKMPTYLNNTKNILLPYGDLKQNHWMLIRIDKENNKIILYDPTHRTKEWRHIIDKLRNNVLSKVGITIPDENIVFEKDIPKQKRDNDCGAYLMKNIECLIRGQKIDYKQKDLDKLRDTLKKEMLRQVDNVQLNEEQEKAYLKNNGKQDVKERPKENKELKEALENQRRLDVEEENNARRRNESAAYKKRQEKEKKEKLAYMEKYNINSPEVINLKKPLLFEDEIAVFDRTKGNNAWLQDEQIDAMVKIMRDKVKDKGILIQDSQFYNRMRYLFNEDERGLGEDENLNKFIEETKKEIKEKKYIYFPLTTFNSHWILMRIDTRSKTIDVYDSYHKTDYDEYINIVKRFLSKVNGDYKHVYHNEVPKQTDGYNCGMFTLKNIECLVFNNGKYDYKQKDLNGLRKVFKQKVLDYQGGQMKRSQFSALSDLRKMRREQLAQRKEKENGQKL